MVVKSSRSRFLFILLDLHIAPTPAPIFHPPRKIVVRTPKRLQSANRWPGWFHLVRYGMAMIGPGSILHAP
ncbi:hypothetical protein F4778DRAFT_192589 [Xylariomycetidae sp. FL2044]|nr:hypothetical protein F4778DRAFT_192589 [Xylariomycetidae sp. FL2044]